MAGVVLENVSRVFPGGVAAVDRFNLEVADQEFVVLVGPSGCGKSTTLRMIAGLEEISAGEIRIGGKTVNGVAPKDRDIAMVFQNYALYPHMSVYKNMAFGLQLRYGSGLLRRAAYRVFWPRRAKELAERRTWIDEQVGQAAKTLGIEALLHRMPRQLSGGERQRVAVGRAIVRQPAAFLFDEPLSNLDARLRVEMRRELKQLHRRLQATILYVTHDQVEAVTLGDRIVVMDRGVIQQVGPPLEVYDGPANRFVAGFIGTPPMNFVEGALAAEKGKIAFRGGGCTLPLNAKAPLDAKTLLSVGGSGQAEIGRPTTLGIRAEDVQAVAEGGPSPGESFARGSGRVLVVEPLGDSTLVHLELEEEMRTEAVGGVLPVVPMVSRADARSRLLPGSRVQVYFDMRRAHLFDALTGVNLARRIEAGA